MKNNPQKISRIILLICMLFCAALLVCIFIADHYDNYAMQNILTLVTRCWIFLSLVISALLCYLNEKVKK